MSGIGHKVAHVIAEVKKPHRAHKCHADGCPRNVPPAFFMCASHWKMVPAQMQAAIWRTYNIGQENGQASVSREYLDAHRAAVAAVAEKERTAPGAQGSLFSGGKPVRARNGS